MRNATLILIIILILRLASVGVTIQKNVSLKQHITRDGQIFSETQEGIMEQPKNEKVQNVKTMEGSIPISEVTLEGTYPGPVKKFGLVQNKSVVLGRDYFYINASYVEYLNSEALDYSWGDVNNDSQPEFVVLTKNALYLFNDSGVVWRANVDSQYKFDRVSIFPEANLIVVWKFNSSDIAYYSTTGTYIGYSQISTTVSVGLIDLDYIGKYLIGKTYTGYILNWTTQTNTADIVLSAVSSSLARNETGLVLVAYFGPWAQLVRLVYSAPNIDVELLGIIPASEGWSDLVYDDYNFHSWDIDLDNKEEFLISNNTMLAIIDTSGGITQYNTTHSCEYVYLYSNWVVGYDDVGRLYVYYPDLDLKATYDLDSGGILIGPRSKPIIYYTNSFRAVEITIGSTITEEPIEINAGWNIIFGVDGILLYKWNRAEYYGIGKHLNIDGEGIVRGFVFGGGFTIQFRNGSSKWYYNNSVLAGSYNISGAIATTYNPYRGEYVIVYSNGTIVEYGATINRWFLPSNATLISLYSTSNGNYALVGITNSSHISIEVLEEGISIFVDASQCLGYTHYNFSGVLWDLDDDGDVEVAYTIYSKNLTCITRILGLAESSSTIWRYVDSLDFNSTVFVGHEHYVFTVDAQQFLVVGLDSSESNVATPDNARSASDGLFIYDSGILIQTSQGDLTLNFPCWRGISRFGLYTRFILYANYTIYEGWGAVDVEDPTVGILGLTNGTVFDRGSVNFSWFVVDDLGVERAVVYVDGYIYGEYLGNGSASLVGLGEGDHEIKVVAWDVAGRSSYVLVVFRVDFPIGAEVVFPENNTFTNSSSVFVDVETFGPVDNITVYVDRELYGVYPPMNGSIQLVLGEGNHTIEVFVMGMYDILRYQLYVFVDLSPPQVESFVPRNNTVIECNWSEFPLDINISFEVTDASGLADTQLFVGDYWLSLGPAKNLTIVVRDEGEYSVHIRLVDKAGNSEDYLYVLRVNAPSFLEVVYSANNSWIRTETVNVSWVSRGIDRVEVYVEGAIYGEYAPNASISLDLDDGVWLVDIVGKGYMDVIYTKIVVKKDTSPPSIMVDLKNGTTFSEGEITITYEIDDNLGIRTAYLYVGDKKYSLEGSKISLVLSEGKYTLRFYAEDYAGNKAQITITINVESEMDNGMVFFLIAFIAGLGVGAYKFRDRLVKIFGRLRRSSSS